jgi:hypothetical protein
MRPLQKYRLTQSLQLWDINTAYKAIGKGGNMVQEEIGTAIEIIDKRIKSLKELRDRLADEFGFNGNRERTLPLPFKTPDNRRKATSAKPTNREVVTKFLKENGPHARKDIATMTGIPVGSVAGVLNDKEHFFSKDAKWHLREEIEEKEEGTKIEEEQSRRTKS